MTAPIQTIFFDVGNTLRIVLPDQEFIDRAEAGLMELIGTTESRDALFAKLEERWKAYRKQSKATLLDASEGELWTQYMLPEYEPNMIFANAPKLTRLWRDHDGRGVARPDAVATIKELCRRGCRRRGPVLQNHDPLLQGPPAEAGPGDLPFGLPLHRHAGGQLRLCGR